MPLDIISMLDAAVIILFFFVFVAAAFRAIQLGRAFVNRDYRALANLMALLNVALLVVGLLVYLQLYFNASAAPIWIDRINAVFVIVGFNFLDRTALVFMETDFFHRDSLHWRRARKSAYVAFFLLLAAGFISLLVLSEISFAIISIILVAVFPFIGYLLAVLVVSGRRSPDVIVKRFMRLLSFALLIFLAGALFNNPFLRIWIVHDVITLIGAYVFYRAVTSLSPLGRARASEIQVATEVTARAA